MKSRFSYPLSYIYIIALLYCIFKGGYTALSKAPANAVSASNIIGGMLLPVTIQRAQSIKFHFLLRQNFLKILHMVGDRFQMTSKCVVKNDAK